MSAPASTRISRSQTRNTRSAAAALNAAAQEDERRQNLAQQSAKHYEQHPLSEAETQRLQDENTGTLANESGIVADRRTQIEHLEEWTFNEGDLFTSVLFTGPTEYGPAEEYKPGSGFPMHATWKLWYRASDGGSHRAVWPPGGIPEATVASRAANYSCLVHPDMNPPLPEV